MLNVSLRPEYSTYSAQSCKACCQVTLTAPDVEEDKRSAVSLSLVLDRSGSMSGSKLDTVKKTTQFLLKQMREADRVGVVSYDDQVKVEVKMGNATADFRAKADTTVMAMRPGGMTNLSGGLFEGLRQQLGRRVTPAEQGNTGFLNMAGWPGFKPKKAESTQSASMDWEVLSTGSEPADAQNRQATRDGVRAVFLFTDGLANQGITQTDKLCAAIKNILEHQAKAPETVAAASSSPPPAAPTPVVISTFGFGSDHSEDMLNAISEAANGTYYYIQKAEDIPTAFAEALGGLLSVYAQTVELTLIPKNGASIAKVLTGFATRTEGDSTVVQVPDIYAEEAKNLLVDLTLPAGADSQAAFLDVAVSYLNVPSATLESGAAQFCVRRAEVVPLDINPDEEIAAQRLRLSTAATLEEAVKLADAGRLDAARDALRAQQAFVEAMAADESAAAGTKQALLYDIMQTLQGFTSTHDYAFYGKKKAMMARRCHRAERSNLVSNVPYASAAPNFAFGAPHSTRPLPMAVWGQQSYANSASEPASLPASNDGGFFGDVTRAALFGVGQQGGATYAYEAAGQAGTESQMPPPQPSFSAYTTKKQSAMTLQAKKAVRE